MKHNRRKYKAESIVAAIFMMASLLWLTISTPFVYAAQQKAYSQPMPADEEIPGSEENTPFSNTTEEKAESGSGSLSEYLHHIHELIHPAGSLHKHDGTHNASVYVAFHGELLCPPPNFIFS